MWRLLRQRDFALLSAGQAASGLGDWLLLVAIPFFVFDVTHSTSYTALAFVAETAPRLVLGPIGGAIADRVDRRRLMIAMDVARALVVAALLLAHDRTTVWVAFGVVLAESSLSQFFLPARAAIVPSLVALEELGAANQVGSSIDAVIRIVGAAVGGAVYAAFGLHYLAVVDAITYVVSAATLFGISAPRPAARPPEPGPGPLTPPELEQSVALEPDPPHRPGIFADLLAGAHVVRQDRLVIGIFAMFGLASLAQGVVSVLLVPFLERELHTGSSGYGLLLSAQGIGALVGSLGLGLLRRVRPTRVMAGGMGVTAVAFAGLVNFGSYAAAVVLSAVAGAAIIAALIHAQTLLQMSVPAQFLGRVFGSFSTLATLALLSGMAFAAVAGGALGPKPALDVAAAVFAASALVAVGLREPHLVAEGQLESEVPSTTSST